MDHAPWTMGMGMVHGHGHGHGHVHGPWAWSMVHGHGPWLLKNSIRLKKFMQVGIDVKCMHTDFGGRGLSGFGDKISL